MLHLCNYYYVIISFQETLSDELDVLLEASFGLQVLLLPASVCPVCLSSVCLCLSLCLSVCLCQSQARPRDNPSPFPARITKFGP